MNECNEWMNYVIDYLILHYRPHSLTPLSSLAQAHPSLISVTYFFFIAFTPFIQSLHSFFQLLTHFLSSITSSTYSPFPTFAHYLHLNPSLTTLIYSFHLLPSLTLFSNPLHWELSLTPFTHSFSSLTIPLTQSPYSLPHFPSSILSLSHSLLLIRYLYSLPSSLAFTQSLTRFNHSLSPSTQTLIHSPPLSAPPPYPAHRPPPRGKTHRFNEHKLSFQYLQNCPFKSRENLRV